MRTIIGLSLPFGLFTGSDAGGAAEYSAAFGGAPSFLDFCERNLDAVELRTVKPDADPRVVLNAVRCLCERSLAVTIHGKLCEADRFFAPYLEMFAAGLQKSYNITVHPAKTEEETERQLRGICALIDDRGYPVRITLENQRMKDTQGYGLCCEVTEIARRINSPHLALCFDFGHQLSNERRGVENAPEDEFLSRVRHTHIHSLGARTHFPLDDGECLLDRNLTGLIARGYCGVLSLELSPERYCEKLDVKVSLEHSLSILKTAAHQVQARLETLDFYKNKYDGVIRRAKEKFDSEDDCAVLVGHAAYALKLGGVRIAVDVAPRIMPIDDVTRKFIYEWLSEFDAVIVTHRHGDHFDPGLISTLPASVKKLIPDFMDFDTEGRISVSDGGEFSLGELSLSFFRSGHFFDGNGVEEYGFAIRRGGETLVFPADVRNYDYEFPHFDNVRAVFTHLWLGRALALKSYEQYTDKFCRFARSFRARDCYVAHLFESNRNIENMWSDIHLELIKETLPEAKALRIGEVMPLDFDGAAEGV